MRCIIVQNRMQNTLCYKACRNRHEISQSFLFSELLPKNMAYLLLYWTCWRSAFAESLVKSRYSLILFPFSDKKLVILQTLVQLFSQVFFWLREMNPPYLLQARYEDLLKAINDKNNPNAESYLDKDLDTALDSFDNLFCRRCRVCILHIFFI